MSFSKTCVHPGCEKQPFYNNPGQKTGIYCAEHKTPTMKNVVSKICDHPRCEKLPSFNEPGEKSNILCRS